jgi:hypothetical protein
MGNIGLMKTTEPVSTTQKSPAPIVAESNNIESSKALLSEQNLEVFNDIVAVVGEPLSLAAFNQLSGNLANIPFIKLVYDRKTKKLHFINNAIHQFHANYIATSILGLKEHELEKHIDEYNRSFYMDPERRFFLGILSLQGRRDSSLNLVGNSRFFTLETVEVDTMDLAMIKEFYGLVKDSTDSSLALYLKPANHYQETLLEDIEPLELPRIYSHELFASLQYVVLNKGTTKGRLRVFKNLDEYERQQETLEWYDILVMPRVPDDIPRLAGIINAHHTTPLSHTNVLASGWKIPNCVQIGIIDRIEKAKLNERWVEYSVNPESREASLLEISRPVEADQTPIWKATKVKLETPEIAVTPILTLNKLRSSDRSRYGTKAANIGELNQVLAEGSQRLIGYYRVRRPPRPNLLPYLAKLLQVPEDSDLDLASWEFMQNFINLPRGIAIPFSIQQQFLESSPKIQQAIGKLKMALELNVSEIDALCVTLQRMIIATKFPKSMMDYIDREITKHLSGVSSFVVRSSSNAEDLENFSAAGIYESHNHVTSSDRIFESIKQVWASVLSPRSVRLRQDVGISLDDVYMGVIIQEEIPSDIGGVMVTTNPAKRTDFRNVYINISPNSVEQVVQGSELPIQYLYNTVEGGGRTISWGNATEDLSPNHLALLQKLALGGRLLQSHFSPNYMFDSPVDIEWLAYEGQVYILQLRPYSE